MSIIINNVVNIYLKQRLSVIDNFLKHPFDVQEQTLNYLVKTARNTEFGVKYNFKDVRSFWDYQQKVPLNDYDSLKKEIERIIQGEQNILWPTPIRFFAKSSGTTSDKSKFIPISKESLQNCHFNAGKDVLATYIRNYPASKLFTGKGLVMGGSKNINKFMHHSYYGDLSAILIHNAPLWVNFFRTPSKKIALMEEWESKIKAIAKQAIHENVTSISGVPSWTLVLIKHILETTQKQSLLDIWPNLELFIHGAVSFLPYKEQFQHAIPSDQMHYLETYNASEGFFALQDQKNSDELLLMLDYGIFYEFLPIEELERPMPKTVSLQDVEIGKNYALVISTNGGLWRYIIGDTIKFTSLYPHRIKITGRTKNFINAFGEELIIDNAERALKEACLATNALITEYTAGPIYMTETSAGGHEWLIEFERLPNDFDKFVSVLDNTLKALNSDYEAKRHKNMTLQMPKVVVIANGTFYEWLKSKGKIGGQHKVPRLANHRNYIEEILVFAKKNSN